MVWPDRKPHPVMFEFKKLVQPVTMGILSAAEGRYTVTNRQDFTDLGIFSLSWEVQVEGIPRLSGTVPLPPAAPGP